MEKALLFEKTNKRFKDFKALKDVSFYVPKGSFFALLGKNGAGKTTLINCLSGMTNLDSGNIEVFGKNIKKNELFAKKSIGVVEQEVAIDPFFTPIEALKLKRGSYGLKDNDKYLDWILEKLKLYDKRNLSLRSLSGGMKRRVMIAKALAHDPNILILDEPTAGVDIELRKELHEFLRELRESGKTIVLTTHYIEEAEKLSDMVAILHHGKLIICKPTNQLLHSYNKILQIDLADGQTISKSIEFEKDIPDIIAKITSNTTKDILNLKIIEPKLEDIFLKFTR